MKSLSHEQLELWKKNGYLLLSNSLQQEEKNLLQNWTEDLSNWPETPGKWMKYFETTTDIERRRSLCRVENFLPYHQGFSDFLSNKDLIEILSQLMGEPAVLFKEKINYKLPGGGGFAAHQDAPAFTTFQQTYHITMMISIDRTTMENGCLEMVSGFHDRGILSQERDGTLHQDVIRTLPWESVEMNPGDILFFDSFVPHRSGPNRSTTPRRALYITYNRKSEGFRREEYFMHKRESFPQECERLAGVDYSKTAGIYNLGNPIL